jgi:hypothetical protein
MVELFTAAGFASGPRSKSASVRPVARLEAPHAGQVERGARPRAPCTGLRISFIENTSPALVNDGLENASRYFRIAPARTSTHTGKAGPIFHRIESSDYSATVQLGNEASC